MASFLTPYELHQLFDSPLVDRDYPLPTELQGNFSRTKLFQEETIDLDKVAPDLRIGIFVGPEVTAKPTTTRGYETKIFRPFYWKDKGTPDFRNIRTRQVGDQFNNGASNAGRIAQLVADIQKVIDDKRLRLQEWMAAQMLLYGSCYAVSDLHPGILIDMEPNIATNATTLNGGRANRANLTATAVTLPLGSSQATLPVINDNGANGKRAWGSTGGTVTPSPVADLQQMLDASWEPITKIYMSDNAWNQLILDPLFSKVITPAMSVMSQFAMQLIPQQQSKEGLKLRGMMGSIPIWTYNAAYQAVTDASTTLTKFLPDGWVVMVSNPAYGVKAYASIQHAGADYMPQETFWNSWFEDEIGVPWVQAQSAPAILHTKINSTVSWKVM